ncbi:DUF6801 domain-containing protein [Streptomyces sp. NPDC058195]|uniref:DUF6801 domain-containing protein n=1 Tax=Streptomyces sp. NPDC058195 TaxID=3346375 RepID=UPI0036E45881
MRIRAPRDERTEAEGRGPARTTVRVAAVGVLALVAGFMPGTGSAADTRTAEADIAYSCDLPSGTQPVAVHVEADLPVSSGVGTEIQPQDVSLSFALPRAALADLPGIESPLVSGSARLLTEVSQRGEGTEVPWQGLAIAETAVPDTGDIALRATGEVPTITPRSSGDVIFSAGQLDVGLTVRDAKGSGDVPSPRSVTCRADPDQSAELASVAVPRPAGATPPGGTSPELSGDVLPDRSATARADADGPAPSAGVPVPDGCTVVTGPIPQVPKPAHGYMAGYSNVNKLDGAVKFKDPGHLRLNLNSSVSFLRCGTAMKSWLVSDGTLDYQGKPQMPPAEATFLTFGFMPTTGKLELSLEDRISIATMGDSVPDANGQYKETTTAVVPVSLRLYDVSVNGEPLDVGPNCRSATPMQLELVGQGETGRQGSKGYTVKNGGPLIGYPDVPPFSGCGATEDLDNLFIASLSSPDNYTKMMQSPLCVEGAPANCPEPQKPTPER